MKVEIKIDGACKEPKIIIMTDKMTDEINCLVQWLSSWENLPPDRNTLSDKILSPGKNTLPDRYLPPGGEPPRYFPQVLSGFKGDTLEILEQSDILRIYALEGKVIAATTKGEYTLRLRLYELEERLDKNQFVRISNSEIINLKKVKNFDLSFTGTICVCLLDGTVTYVSRRYVSKIKQVLGV